MRNIFKLTAICFLLLFAGCVPSLHPLYTDHDLIFDAGLIGTWSDKDKTETWVFLEAGEKEYKIIHTDKDDKSGEFTARLVRFGGKTFLDLAPIRAVSKTSDFHKAHFLKMHTFVLVSQTSSTVQLSILELDWLKDHLEKNPSALKHETIGGELILTASSRDMQAFLLRHIDTPGAFSNPGDFSLIKRGAK